MDSREFREKLRRTLLESSHRVLLRIVPSPAGNSSVELTGKDILDRSSALAERHAMPRTPSVVLLLLPHCPELFLLQIGLVLRGHLPAILPWPTRRMDVEKYQRNLLHQLQDLPADQLITIPKLAENLGAGLSYPVSSCAIENAAEFERSFARAFTAGPEVAAARRDARSFVPPGDEALFLQFSGGTTGTQKAVVVTAAMLSAQLERLQRALDFGEGDGVVSWLPLYHDMGLIACLWFPLWFGVPSLHFAASDWLLNPETLFQQVEQFRGTFCWLPNFAFSYLEQRRTNMKRPYSLAHVRACINCSEPVRLRSIRNFAERFADWGIREESLQASYAMAENVFAVTQSCLGKPLATFPRSRVQALGGSHLDLAFGLLDDVFVSSGAMLVDNRIRIVDGAAACEDGRPGEIQIQTPSLFQGYWGSGGFRTAAFTDDGWYATGDYGFASGGQLYVIGRIKDIVIVGGQNIFPEDVEAVVASVEGVYPGRAVAFGVEDEEYGTQALAIVAEMRGEFDSEKSQLMEEEILRLVLAAIGIAPRHVAVVPERWMVKSTAGKISRHDTMLRFLSEKSGRTQREVQ